MENKRYKPLFDKLYFWMVTVTNTVVIAMVIIPLIMAPIALAVTLPVFVFVNYFLLSPAFGYVELREEGVFIKFGFFMKRYIPYSKIRCLTKERKFYADSMLALKNALDHVNIKYNRFDIVSVSVDGNDELISEIAERACIAHPGL